MATGKAFNEKPYVGNSHVQFDEGKVASSATSRRGSLLYKTKQLMAAVMITVVCPLWAATETVDGIEWTYSLFKNH